MLPLERDSVQDMTRLPTPGQSPSTSACPPRQRNPPGERSPPLPTGISAHRRRAELSLGGRMGFFLLMFIFLSFVFSSPSQKNPLHPLWLAHPWVAVGLWVPPGVLLPHLPGQGPWESRESSWHCSRPSSRASVSPSTEERRFPHWGAGQGLLQVVL